MPAKTPDTAAPETTSPNEAQPKTYTNWSAFEKAGLKPTTIYCKAYRPVFRNDSSCHTKLIMKADSLVNHAMPEPQGHGHGGGFLFCLKKTDSNKPVAIWGEIQNAALEAVDFRCEVCNAQLRFHPTSFNAHLKPHAGKTKQAYQEFSREHPGAVGFFSLKLSKERPENLEDADEFADSEV